MLVRLVAILVLFLGVAMWSVGDGPELDRVALAEARVSEQREAAYEISRTEPEMPELAVEIEKAPAAEIVTQASIESLVASEPAPATDLAALAPESPAPLTQAIEEAVEIAVEEPDVIELYVTGGRVNLRAGPSTRDIVIGRVTRGQRVELVDFVEDGWAQIRVDGLERTAFMSGDFLSDSQ